MGVVIFNKNNGKLFEYSSVPLDQLLHRYATYSGPSERRKHDPVGVSTYVLVFLRAVVVVIAPVTDQTEMSMVK